MEPPPPRRVPEQRTKRPVDYAWQPLQGLSSADLQYDFGRAEDWKARWDAFRARPDVQARLQTGLQRMERLWSIETGIIEGLYTLNQGTTTTLLEYGFVPNVIRAQDTNIEPERLLLILNDHHTSVGLVHGYIRDERPLSAHTIRELHACITIPPGHPRCRGQPGAPGAAAPAPGCVQALSQQPHPSGRMGPPILPTRASGQRAGPAATSL